MMTTKTFELRLKKLHFLRRFNRTRLILLCAFLLPVILMGSYFAYRSMAPFGSSSILTVDLGQQYIDFYSYFRATLLHHPETFFYSFSKDLGGDMIGIFSYYLMSPLNLLILAFPGKALSIGVLLILLLKYGLAGFSFGWLLHKTKLQSGIRILAFSTAYALMGWMIANQLNVIWLDVLYLLPPVIWGLIKLVNNNRPWTYIIWFAALLIINYYMAWMVAIFTVLFMIWQLTNRSLGFKTSLQRFIKYIGSSLLAGLFACVLLLPTFYALSQSKGTYTETKFNFKLEYFPFKMLGKLVTGSFNFKQMPSGQPNLFVGMLMLMAFLLYFVDRRFHLRLRLVSFLITVLFLSSFCIQALDLVWHAGQFPVWYPYRFSFLFSFWVLWLAAHVLTPNFRIGWRKLVPLVIIIGAIHLYLKLNLSSFSYLSNSQLLINLGFSLVALIWLCIPRGYSPVLYDLLLVMLATFEVATNAYTSLNNISYVSQADFGDYTTQLDKTVNRIKQQDDGFYRIGKTFMRTKDDPMQADYNGASHFGSTLEPSIPSFFGSIGQPDGDGFVAYTNGTQVSDSLLGMQYFMGAKTTTAIIGQRETTSVLPATANKPDLNRQTVTSSDTLTTTYKNKRALSLAFAASDKINQLKATTKDPVAWQSTIYQTLAGDTNANSLFQVQNFDHVTFQNVQSAKKITGTIFSKQSLLKPASVTLTFIPKTNDSYYLTFGANLTDDVASYYLNGKKLTQYPTFRNTVAINVASKQKGQPVTITFKLKQQTLWLQNISLYQLNQAHFDRLNQTLKQSPLKVQQHSNTKISGTINVKKQHQDLMTTIPYSKGWHIRVDGHEVPTKKVINTFLAAKISKGHHHVVISYRPPFFVTGLLISVVSIGGAICFWWFKRRR